VRKSPEGGKGRGSERCVEVHFAQRLSNDNAERPQFIVKTINCEERQHGEPRAYVPKTTHYMTLDPISLTA